MLTSNLPKTKSIVLFGTGDMAQIAYEYFTYDSPYRVRAFVADREYITSTELCGIPVIAYDELPHAYPPSHNEAHVCMVYNDMNEDRQKKCALLKSSGYRLASYISSGAFVSPSARIGEHAFVFEDNTIQPYVTIGDNCILWSGNHVGHHSRIGNNVFVSSHVVISGHCSVGDNSFIGVNTTLANNTVIGQRTWVMHGATLSGDIPPGSFVKTARSDWVPLNESALAKALGRHRR